MAETFKVTLGICSYESIKARAWDTLNLLGQCPDPKVTVKILDGDALISRSRSLMAKHFLENTDDDVLMFLDHDIVISPLDATKIMRMAYELKLDIVGAAYVTKSKRNPGFAIRPLGAGKLEFGLTGKLYEVESISTGCMAINRNVFQKFISSGIAPLCRHGSNSYWPFFQHQKMVINNLFEDVSEDWYFCEKAAKLGFKVWCDTTIKLGHIGNYEYNWDDILDVKLGKRQIYEGGIFNIGNHSEPPKISVPHLNGNEAAKAVIA